MNEKTTPADDDALLTLDEATLEFGVFRAEWERAIKEGMAYVPGVGRGLSRVRRADARETAKEIYNERKRVIAPKGTT